MMGDDGPVEDQDVPLPVSGSAAAGRGWAVPGSAAEQPGPAGEVASPDPGAPEAPVGGRVVHPGSPVPAEGGVPRVALRPMTAADVLDGGFAVLKARPRRLFGMAAALVVPTQLVVGLAERATAVDLDWLDFFNDPAVANEEVGGGELANQYLVLGLDVLLSGLVLVFVAAAIAHLVGQWIMGRDAPAGEMLRHAGRRWWPLVGSFFVVKAAETASAIGCWFGLVFVMPLFVAVAPVVGVEGGGAWAVVTRGVRLVRPRYFPVMGVSLLMALASLLLSNALSALPQAVAAWIGVDDAWWLLAFGAIIGQVIVLPFVAAATVLLYFDLRVRTEGLDLEMAAGRVLDRAG